MKLQRNNFQKQLVIKVFIAVIACLLLWLVASEVQGKLDRKGISTGFDFLWSAAGYDISESLIPFNGSNSYAYALLAGFSNTLKVSISAIFASVLLGFLAAVAQMSQNHLASGASKLYVGVVRNTPLLLQLFFWFGVFTVSMPSPKEAIVPLDGLYISNRGISFPAPSFITLLAIVGFFYSVVMGFRAYVNAKLSKGFRIKLKSIAFLMMSLVLLMYLFWFGDFEFPRANRFSVQGGAKITPEFLAIFTGLSVYTGTYIAEAIRGAVEAIPQSQIEAAKSIGLNPSLVLILVVIPQAVRIAMPAVVSELLNLVKNSSLGVAVGYPELVSVGNTAMNQTGQAIELIVIYMLVYVSINFVITKLFTVWEQRYEW